MTAEDGDDGTAPPDDATGSPPPDSGGNAGAGDAAGARTEEEIDDLRTDLRELRADLEDRTLDRSDLESDLKRYVRRRVRRGHARGWGPYLVLLYGTAMTLGAFFFLEGLWAIAAMIVLWLSTLGLYALMVVVGVGIEMLGLPRRAIDRVRDR